MTLRRLEEDNGAALIEWALAVVLIAVVAVGAVGFFGNQVSGLWGEAGAALSGDLPQVTDPPRANPNSGPPGLCKRDGQAPGNGVGSGNQPPPMERCDP